MNPNLKAVLDYLDQLSAKLGAAGQELFKQMVYYRWAQAITAVAIALLIPIGGIVAFVAIGKASGRARMNFKPTRFEDTYDSSGYTFVRFLVLCGSLVLGLTVLYSWMPDLISPSGAVVNDLVRGLVR